MTSQGRTKEEIANKVCNMRNQDKVDARKKMNLEDIQALEERNIKKYGNKIGPDASYLYKKIKKQFLKKGINLSDEDIWNKVIEGSMRKDPVINTLLGIEH